MKDILLKYALKYFLKKTIPCGMADTGEDESIDYYTVSVLNLEIHDIDDAYIYAHTQNALVAIKYKKIPWQHFKVGHFYHFWHERSGNLHSMILERISRFYMLNLILKRRFDNKLPIYQDTRAVLAALDYIEQERINASIIAVLDTMYGKGIRSSSQWSNIKSRVEKIITLLNEKKLIHYTEEYITEDGSTEKMNPATVEVLPSGIELLAKYEIIEQKHSDTIRTSKAMLYATFLMFIAVMVQAYIAYLQYSKAP